ncbi:hypothetical protein U879_13180 [Defluviimonas sp. 20V17]|jgi:tetratricopeptide (TPR) repeat protein|uniref:Uncharacterized protein n=2 Tax=Allgaiera indica TaxID=765699 RepID=A0AAN4ZZ43_9RHOB|nr:hypothetical protein [Allgaiera indica]KDB03203.1 hypothetical protein U879_13180 [Defluviimonas sp. 20V17]GHE01076.1 hypothetical protein GCM10008024_15280 [Allgaiera indica]
MAMVARSRTSDEVLAARRSVDEADATTAEKAEMLMEMAMGIQQKPKTPEDLLAAVELYEQAIDLCTAGDALLSARIRARMSTALMSVPSDDPAFLKRAREEMETALATLTAEGKDEEVAEAEMNLGLICQNLAGMGMGKIQDAIGAYQRALRVFDRTQFPAEFAILQNNLATAFLSIPFSDDSGKMREALAVQSFEEGLKVVNLIDHPTEYAMLQNNLGNALQYASSSHPVENGFRALEAYDEALKVRTENDTPGEFANTIANKANCLANLPDDPENPEGGNAGNLAQALGLYHQARKIFAAVGETGKVQMLAEAIGELQDLLKSLNTQETLQ